MKNGNDVVLRVEADDHGTVELQIKTTPAVAVVTFATAIKDIAEHLKKEDGKEACMDFLDMVGLVITPKNIWEKIEGRKRSKIARMLDKMFK